VTALDLPVRTHPDERRQAEDGGQQQRRRRRREYGLFALLVAPNLLVIAVFAYWPILYNAFLSLTDWNMIAARPTFVGLANYGRTLTDPAFHKTLWITVVFTGFIVAGSLVIGLALAFLFNLPLKAAVRSGRSRSPRTSCPVPRSPPSGCSSSTRATACCGR
jgi:multiple sugar transport system permease protein/sn-glycerol 3-phosphate transport system permease protein